MNNTEVPFSCFCQLYLKFLVICLVISSGRSRSPCFARYQNGTLGNQTKGTVSITKEAIYAFHNTENLNNDQAVIVKVSANASQDFPLLVVIQQQKGVSSWTVPFSSQEKTTYRATSHVLCPGDNFDSKTNETSPFFWVSLSSSSLTPVYYTLDPKLLDDFMLNLDQSQTVLVSPSEPTINSFQFPKDIDTVLVKAESPMSACSIVSVQGTKCPVFDLARNVEFTGNFQTMRHKSGIVVQKDDFPSRKFYIVIVVLADNERCKSGKNNENPFRNDDIFRGSNYEGYSLPKNKKITKSVTLKIVKIPSEDEYAKAIVIPILVFLGFYLISALVIFFQHKYGMTILSVQSQNDVIGDEDQSLMHEDDATTFNYGSTETDAPVSAPSQTAEQLQDIQAIQQSTDEDLNDHLDGEFDFLNDIEEDKEIYRLKKELYLSDLSKKKRKRIQKKYSLYQWNLIIIAVFYALPVIQLVFTYQRVLNASGDQDICYYNFYCSRPMGPLSSFNNVYSNIGYVMLGLLFFLLVWRRDIMHQRECVSDDEHLGIPQHYGVFYALATALIMEGILSACYHVCPSYTNFQFDTSFMYIISCLIIVQLYSTRHPDLAAKPHIVFGIFAAIILVAVSGVVFTSFAFWTIFCFALIVFSVYSTTQMYYMGRIRFSISEMRRSISFVKHDLFSCPVYKDRMILLLLANGVNWGLAINGMATEPKDFASYLLAILIVNGLIYLLFYVVMKLSYKEKIPLLSVFCSLFTLICWAGSLTFFLQGLTSWQKSPAYSRENNQDCILFNFYDDHDVWHFLSAVSLFLSFMILLTLNDDLKITPRNQIRVF